MYDDTVENLCELQLLTENCENQSSCLDCKNKDLCNKYDNKTLGATSRQAADAIEELSKRLNSVTAERDAAMKRLCEWCGVGCSMENRRAELCEIAPVGLEFLAEEGE